MPQVSPVLHMPSPNPPPAQHGWPALPQALHEVVTAPSPPGSARQLNPVSQVPPSPPQQAWSDPPHAVQVPPIPIKSPVQRPPV